MEVTETAAFSAAHPVVEPDPEPARAAARQPRASATVFKLAALLIIPVAACAVAYFLVRTRFYEAHDPTWIRASNRVFMAHGIDCQVLLYGDSTAITGLDPQIVARETGLTACNIAQTKGAIVVLGTSALDRYLQNNKRPQYMVLQFSGADFYHATNWGDTPSYMEGGIALMRYYSFTKLFSMLPQHPDLLIGVMRYAYVTAPVNWWRDYRHPVKSVKTSETPIDVHFTRPEPPFTSCAGVEDLDPLFHRPDASFIQWLRDHYGQYADHLIIDVAPTSPCDPRVAYLRATLPEIDNTLQVYPLSFFNEGYEHYTDQGAEHLSMQVARQIKSLETVAANQASALHSSLSTGELH